MSVHTDIQIIKQGGKPVFAVVPYDKWIAIAGDEDEKTYIPHEVVGYQLKKGLSLIAAWRKHLKITQQELAAKTGMSQPAIAQIEKPDSKTQRKTLKKIALAMNLEVEQITN
ncbi:MAG: helix-turn-helix transcriptional regulator [Desulfobulbaceae bacterium]|nr:helix-turn-helix transcriptional regulator [Desulfobulbaceae bacterium]